MQQDLKQENRFDHLRRRAEELINQLPEPLSNAQTDIFTLIHELRVYQAELEIQNEELKRAQQEITMLQREYEDLYELAPCGYITLNAKGIITRCNLTGAMLLGDVKTRLNGRGVSGFIAEQSRAAFWNALKQFDKQSEEKQSVELVLPGAAAKGAPRWVRADIQAERCPTGEVRQWRLVLMDITHSIRLQKQLLQAQKMQSIGLLAGGIAHEFNNILAIIIGNADLALDEVPELSPAIDHIGEIVTSAFRARDMVQQLLTFGRKQDLEKKPVKIVLVVENALKLIRSTLPANIDVQQDIARLTDWVFANATQIHQLIINLCSNAADAMPESGGKLLGRLTREEIDDESEVGNCTISSGSYVRLMIRDTGQGMDPEILGRIFEPYFTTKEIGKGTGLGLAVVHGIVECHSGYITVESEPGAGTVFTVFFPVYTDPIEREPEKRSESPTGTERILLVDDEAAIMQLGTKQLGRLGYHVTGTTDPIKALDLFCEAPNRFDLVITDMAMPHMTGDQLALEILKIRPKIPIILCTGYTQKISEQRAFEIGIASFLMKPIERIDFALCVRKTLDQAKPSEAV
jgi:PAS domain S-box-containing protein